MAVWEAACDYLQQLPEFSLSAGISVALRVPHAPDPITEEEVRHLGHGGGPGLQRSPIYSIAILDVQAEEARRVRPLLFRIERHYYRVADPELGVPDGPVLIVDPGYLLRTKRLSNEI